MTAPRSRKRPKTISFILLFLVIFAGGFIGIQFITKTGFFKVPGVIYYGDSLTSEERSLLESIFPEDIQLDKDVTISATNSLELKELQSGEYLYNIYVPVTDFYSTLTNIDVSSVEEIYDTSFGAANHFELIPIMELDFSKKLLSINHKYYLDDLKNGAVYRIISLDSEKFKDEIEPKVSSALARTFPSSDTMLTFAQTGVTAFSRGMNRRLEEVAGDATYFTSEIAPFLSSFDITHTSNESSFTDLATSSNICSDKRFIHALTDIGLDVVELTGNHNVDCGDEAARQTIDMYSENNIKIVGGGKSADEAKEPLTLSQKNSNITMLAFNQSTGGATLDDTPGANQYYETVAAKQIKEAKERGDLVIVDVQYYECSAYASEYEDATCDRADSSAGDQVGFFRHLIDLGADVVVGTSAHQAQTFELYGDGVIYYGLGNLFFDQVWWPGTTRSLILSHYIYNGKLLQTRLHGTIYGQDMQTKLLDADTLAWWLERLVKVKPTSP